MKKLIALTALLSMSVAFADDVIYGTFVLNSNEPEVVLCVPWVNPGSTPGSTDGAIPVKDLIQTSTLENGDLLFYYDNGYKAWQVQEVEEKKVWVGVQFVKKDKEDKEVVSVGAGDAETLKRGNAVILKRNNVNGRQEKRIIINGQVGGTFGGLNLARTDGVVHSLIAPPNPNSETHLKSGTWNGVQEDDCVIVGLKPYYYKNGVWGERKGPLKVVDGKLTNAWVEADPSIPAGQGAWFVSQGAGANVTWTF